jgi:hypothetical protein
MKQIHFDRSVDIFDDWGKINDAALSVEPTEREWDRDIDDLMSVSFKQALDYAFHLGMMEAACSTGVKIFVKEGKLKVQIDVFDNDFNTLATRDIPIHLFSMEAHKYFELIGEDAECADDEETITVKFTKIKT